MSGRSYLRLIERLMREGWRVELIYLALPSVEMSRLRVAERVAHGGHDIPVAAIERRFARSLQNLFALFAQRVSRARCYLNSGDPPVPVFVEQAGSRAILDAAVYEYLMREAQA